MVERTELEEQILKVAEETMGIFLNQHLPIIAEEYPLVAELDPDLISRLFQLGSVYGIELLQKVQANNSHEA
jgi:hypothetical protein